ncbi:hypothetical protein [Flavobacterium psychrotrophum]|uniref:hypothetical protein n=1 Tax=Flavobacterium psychrotrophum TaxID=2294119 RepID=UPI000E3148EB|nr:hypothetical protein [Flavobacterium psychrotrophum]
MRVVILIVVMALCCSCKRFSTEAADDIYYFAEAQPLDKDTLLNIPKKFLGHYVSEYGDTLQISKEEIAYNAYYGWAISKKDSFFSRYNGDESLSIKALRDSLSPDMRIVKQDSDSIYLATDSRQTLFSFSDNTAKLVNGDFISNTKDSIYWHVAAYSVKKDSLYITRFLYKEDLGIVKTVVKDVHANADTTRVLLSPTKHEFKRLLKSNAGTVQGFRKIH